jgi:type II secretory pathway pseudopilin PulG
MKTRLAISRSEAGFTMAEIAIALGVIAVALIAIIGILPSGLQVQRDNREETIINQDARVLLQAIRTGGRDTSSDIGAFVVGRNVGLNMVETPGGLPTAQVIQMLSDRDEVHTLIFSAISGGIASRGTDMGFRYRVVNSIMDSANTNLFGGANFTEFTGTLLSNQVYEVRLRFSWPVGPEPAFKLGSEANRYTARTLVSGLHTNGVVYAQEFYQPTIAP